MQHAPFYKRRLNEELASRVEGRSGYSLRAFAKALGTDPGALSRILSGKKIPTYKMSQQIFEVLDLSPEEQTTFLSSIAQTRKTRGLKRMSPELKRLQSMEPSKPRELSVDVFRVISDWYHYAILELTFTDEFQSDPAWIARQLGISKMEAKLAIERLLSLELLNIQDGKYVKADFQLTTANKSITSAAHRRRQRQILEKAIDALENEAIASRSNTAMTMAIDPGLIEAAKQKIDRFTNELCLFLESGSRSKVYELSISLFPLQKERKK